MGSRSVRTIQIAVIATIFFTFGIPAPAASRTTAPSSKEKGPLATTSAEYRLPAGIDNDILWSAATEIWARVFWPSDLIDPLTGHAAKKHPLLIFLHGNHGTCGEGSPRTDRNCQYTREGTCPAGYIVTPNHEGYNYVAENLASWGYVVVSINANRGITCGSGGSDDSGLILARGRLVLKHLQYWNDWSTSGGSPTTLGPADQFIGGIDLTNIGLMGHSRGGEGVRAALNLYRDPSSIWAKRMPNLDIKAIYEIGAVDGQSNRVLDAPSVAWTQLLPLCDGDVSDLEGRAPFERMMRQFSFKHEAEARPSAKSLSMVWGANHNFFNTEWQSSDASSCAGSPAHQPIFDDTKSESSEQQAIALQSMTAFFRAHVGVDSVPSFAQNFDTAYALPAELTQFGTVDRDFIAGFELAKFFRVDDFTRATGVNASGSKNSVSKVSVKHDQTSQPTVANVDWKEPGDDQFFQTNFAKVGHGTDISSFDFLDFRVGRKMDDPATELLMPVDFSLHLVAADETLSSGVAISAYTRLTGPPNDTVELTQTVRIPLADFGKIDFTKIRGVRFVFDKTEQASIRLAHVRFGVKSENLTPIADEHIEDRLAISRAVAVLFGGSLKLMDATPAATTPPEQMRHANPSTLSTPFSLTGPRGNQAAKRASWMPPRKIPASRYLDGETAVELTVSTNDSFPVMNSLPVLNIENRVFPISRFPSNGKTHSMIFTIPKSAYDLLPMIGRAQVQYGIKAPSRVWELPDFSKAENNAVLDR